MGRTAEPSKLNGRVHIRENSSQTAARQRSEAQRAMLWGFLILGFMVVTILVARTRLGAVLPTLLYVAVAGSLLIVGAAFLLYAFTLRNNPPKIDVWFSMQSDPSSFAQNGNGAQQSMPPRADAIPSRPPLAANESPKKVIHLG